MFDKNIPNWDPHPNVLCFGDFHLLFSDDAYKIQNKQQVNSTWHLQFKHNLWITDVEGSYETRTCLTSELLDFVKFVIQLQMEANCLHPGTLIFPNCLFSIINIQFYWSGWVVVIATVSHFLHRWWDADWCADWWHFSSSEVRLVHSNIGLSLQHRKAIYRIHNSSSPLMRLFKEIFLQLYLQISLKISSVLHTGLNVYCFSS